MNTDLVVRAQSSLEAAPLKHFRFHETHLELIGNPTEEEWAEVTTSFIRFQQRSQWIVGDLLLLGERRYGETYAQVVDSTGYTPETLANICSVNGRIPPERRRAGLSWSHHAAVAYLEADVQDRLLEEAEKHGLSSKQLRESVATFNRALKNGGELPAPKEPAKIAGSIGPNGREADPEPEPKSHGAVNIQTGASDADLFEQASEEPETLIGTPVAPAQVEIDVDPIAEWERAEAENEALRERIAALEADDSKKALSDALQRYAQLEGRLQQEITRANEAEKQSKYQGRILEQLRKILKVDSNSQIVGALVDRIQ